MELINKHYTEENLIEELSEKLLDIIKESDDWLIVNIGTNVNIGDSLSPFVGTFLKENGFKHPVYGTIKEPIHALNIEKNLKEVFNKHPNATIIGIDACLGKEESIGKIQLRNVPIFPGKGVGKCLPSVGSYSIVGIVDNSELDIVFTS